MTEEDLVQESHIVFLKLKRTYTEVDNPKWFMTLYKTAFTNRINDLSNKKTRSVPESLECDMGEDTDLSNWCHNNGNDGYFQVLLDQIPQELRTALNFLDGCNERIYEEIRAQTKADNEKLCSWMGLDAKKVNIFAKTKRYFS